MGKAVRRLAGEGLGTSSRVMGDHEGYATMPAATVSFVASSMRMNAPVAWHCS